MADKETGLNIAVSAYADKNSAKEAVSDLTKGVLSSLKDGYIEVPAEIKTSFNKGSKELKQAQDDVIKQWEKMSKEGFSSSGKYLDELVEKYKTFKSLASKENKGNSKQLKWVKENIGTTLEPYIEQKKELDKIVKNFETTTKDVKKITKRSNKKSNYSLPSDEEIASDIKKHQYSGVKSTGPRGYKRDTGFDTGVATSRTVLATERGGSYEVKGARQAEISRQEALKENAKTLKVTVDKELANKLADEARAKGGNKHQYTDAEKAKGIASAVLPELAKLLGGIEKDRPDASSDKFFNMLDAVLKLNENTGMKTIDSVMSTLNMSLHKYYNTEGTLGIGDGTDKDAGSRNPKVEAVLKGLLKEVEKRQDKILKETMAIDASQKEVKKSTKSAKTSSKNNIEDNSLASKMVNELTGNNIEQTQKLDAITKASEATQKAVDTNTNYDKIESTAERVSDSKQENTAQENEQADTKTMKALTEGSTNTTAIATIKEALGGKAKEGEDKCPCQAIFENIRDNVKIIADSITSNIIPPNTTETVSTAIEKSGLPDLYREFKDGKWTTAGVVDRDIFKDITDPKKLRQQMAINEAKQEQEKLYNGEYIKERSKATGTNVISSRSQDRAFFGQLKNTLTKALNPRSEAERIMRMSAEDRARESASRLERYGETRGRSLSDTGDIARFRRSRQLWRGDRGIANNKNLLQDVTLTPGLNDIDTSKILDGLQNSLQKGMFKAQTGGAFRNLIGSMTGYIGMESLEKSRAKAEGLNQVLANTRQEILDLINDIQGKENTLHALEASGNATFDDNGKMTSGTLGAQKLFTDMENQKDTLRSMLAEADNVDAVIKSSHGNINKIVRNLGFVAPELMKNNTIIQNINAGLDKSGRALRFQTRTGEVLNYTFQLMARSVGRMWKNWMMQLNPITQIKKAFSDFMGYDVKWKRTMNVIKYNIRTILRPFMQWLAQQLVNILGVIDIISMKIQSALGKIPVSLFDQSAANAEKMREELEAAANVTAGFDELHDIGSDNSAENDLLGDIYTPQLSEGWQKFAEGLGNIFANIAKVIKKCIDNWKIFAGLLAAFVIAKALLDLFSLFGGLSKILGVLFGLLGKVGGLLIKGLGKIGGLIVKGLGATAFGRGIIEAITGVLTGKAGLLTTLKSIFVGHDAITAFGAWGETLGALFVQGLGVALGGAMVAKGFDMVADSASYNIGLMEAGGNAKDKKHGIGGKILGTAGGAILGAFLVGGPLAIGIGAIAGLITTSLAPAFEKLAVNAKNANNEMQKIEYYEGQVKGAQTQVDIFDEQLQLLKQSLDDSTQSVYDQGEQLGISRSRMDELIQATQNGTFTVDMLTGSETGLAGSLTDLAQKQEHVTQVSEKLEEAQRKLLKAQTDLSIAQDVEAGNFELAAARIEVAEAQSVYSTEEATAKRIQLYKEAGKEERDNLLQDLTQDQIKRMGEYMATTNEGLGKLSKSWEESSKDTQKKILDAVGPETQNQLKQNMNSMDAIIKQHASAWQKIGDTLKEVFGFFVPGWNPTTWTYNGEDKYYKEAAKKYKAGNTDLFTQEEIEEMKRRGLIPRYALGTNYVPNDGLAYLHAGEAVIPKKYNQPYQPNDNSRLESAIDRLNQQVSQISSKVDDGIAVRGQFVQKGSDLVATVEKANNKLSNNVLNNKVYAR